MTNKLKETSFMKSAKGRLVIAGLVLLGVLIGIFMVWHHKHEQSINAGSASVSAAPNIQSLPGGGDPSSHYVKEQNTQNTQEEVAARQKGTSAVPTITRPSFKGSMNAFGTLPKKSSNSSSDTAYPINKVVVQFNSGATQTASSCRALRLQGYTAGELKTVGFGAVQLHSCGYSVGDLAKAGFSAKALKAAGFTAAQLKNSGFTAGQLATAGFDAKQLQNAGFSAAQIKAAGLGPKLADGVLAALANVGSRSRQCSVANIKKERQAGWSALKVKQQGCSVGSLKSAGFTAAELKAAGFSAKQLHAAGFTAAQLKNAGFNVDQLKNAGFSAKQLKQAGFSAAQLKQAGFSAGQLHQAGFTANALKNAGFSAKQLRNAGYSAKQLHNAGFSAAQLKQAGYNAGQLKAAGFTAKQLAKAGFSAKQLRAAGYSAKALKQAGLIAAQLRSAGYNPSQLLRAGFSPNQASGLASEIAQLKSEIAHQSSLNKHHQHAAVDHADSASINNPDSPEAQLARYEKLQQRQMNQQQLENAVEQDQGAMTMEAQKMLAGWSNTSTQMGEVTVVKPKAVATNGELNGKNGAANVNIIKAGTIMFGVLETSINTDEQSPIMAKIVTGPLKGSKLLGHFVRVKTRVLIKFNLLNVPALSQSVPINAVAIDPDTARTALSGYVNNHYFLRYGTLFASAFLSGISDAIVQSGTTTHYFLGLPTSTTHGKLSVGQQVAVGMGKVGDQYANVMGKNFDTPPTVKIRGGTGIGLLIMSDLHLPDSMKLPAPHSASY